ACARFARLSHQSLGVPADNGVDAVRGARRLSRRPDLARVSGGKLCGRRPYRLASLEPCQLGDPAYPPDDGVVVALVRDAAHLRADADPAAGIAIPDPRGLGAEF